MTLLRVISGCLLGVSLASASDQLLLEEVSLFDGGIEPQINYDFSVWSNVSGGLTRGTRWNNMFQFGFDAYSDKLEIWQGGNFTATALWLQGDLNANPISGLGAGFDLDPNQGANAIRAYEIKLEQVLVPDVLWIKFGQIVADDTFMITEQTGHFINSGFGDLPTLSTISNYPEEPLAAPGIYLEWTFAEGWQYATGLYTSDAGPDSRDNVGFQWRLGGDAGYAWFNEVRWDTKVFGNDGHFRFGFFSLLGGTLTDQRTGRAFTGENIYSLYLTWDQTLIARANGDPHLAMFWRMAHTPEKARYLVTDFYTDAGLLLHGTFPGREGDVLGVAINYAAFTQGFRAATPTAHAQQWVIELTYEFQVYDGIMVRPDAQFVLNPQNATSNHAIVLGLMTSVNF